MLGTCITAGIITIEIGIVAYNLHKQGVFTELKNKFTKQVRDTAEHVSQPILKELLWKKQLNKEY